MCLFIIISISVKRHKLWCTVRDMRLNKCSIIILLSANIAQRRIVEMANDVEKTFTSELQQCMLAIQLDESTFESLYIIMAHVRFHSSYLNDTVEEFLFANYLEIDSKRETIFFMFGRIYKQA